MDMGQVDLHTHSTCSDGTYTPAALMDYAAEKHLRAIALTDHDTMAGIDEAQARIEEQRYDLELVPGIEFSTSWQVEGSTREQEVHVVALFLDRHNAALQTHLRDFVASRIERNKKMCRLLTEAGMPVPYETLEAENPGAVITRAHIARFMLEHGYAKDKKEIFSRHIGEGCPCYVPREKITPFDAVRVALQAQGVPVLAHPMLYKLTEEELTLLARRMKEAGCIGIEAIYSTYTQAQEHTVRRIAADCGLLISGGSDFHGDNKPGLGLAVGYGRLFVPASVLETLRTARV